MFYTVILSSVLQISKLQKMFDYKKITFRCTKECDDIYKKSKFPHCFEARTFIDVISFFSKKIIFDY